MFFSVGIDVSDNELTALEAIHLFVEILDHYFSNVCELDLVFNFHKVHSSCTVGSRQMQAVMADVQRPAAHPKACRLCTNGKQCEAT